MSWARFYKKLDQDIVSVVKFLNATKKRLHIRETWWEYLLNEVSSFCDSHDILIPKLDESYLSEKSKRKSPVICYSHHLCVEAFFVVIDVQLQKLNDRFDVVSIDLLLAMGSLNLVNSFSNFDKDRIKTLAKCYPCELDNGRFEIWVTNSILSLFICEVVIQVLQFARNLWFG